MNSTGESDLANYYDAVRSFQENTLSPEMQALDRILVIDALGTNDPSVRPEWRPIRQMTQAEIADIATKWAGVINTLAGTQIFDDRQLAEAGAAVLKETGLDNLKYENLAEDNDAEGAE